MMSTKNSISLQCFLLFLLLISPCNSIRKENNISGLSYPGEHALVPDYSTDYYYRSLGDKMTESMSINNCSLRGLGTLLLYGKSEREADLTVKVVPPPKYVTDKYGTEGHEKLRVERVFFRTSSSLCKHAQFIDFKRGYYKRAKGCIKMMEKDKNGIYSKIINTYGATLHPEAFRCENGLSIKACTEGATSPGSIDNSYRKLNSYPFLITAENVIVSRGGMLAFPCGPFGLFSSCESVKWGVPAASNVVENVIACRKLYKADNQGNRKDKDKDRGYGDSVAGDSTSLTSSCPFENKKRVFVMTQYDDTQIGQFILEALPKLVYHLPFLHANPDIKIHYGFTKQPTLPNFVLPHLFFKWLGVADRLINGTFYAEEVYMPREGGCQDAGYNAWEIMHQREFFLQRAGVDMNTDWLHGEKIKGKASMPLPKRKRSIVVIRRSASPYTQNQADYLKRRWPKPVYELLLKELAMRFPKHRIDVFSDLNSTLMSNPAEQVRLFHDADIVFGIHGAGLTNTLYMQPGGIVVEVVPFFDSRHAPIIGIFPRLSHLVGLHHYTYHLSDGKIDPIKLINDTIKFANEIKLFT